LLKVNKFAVPHLITCPLPHPFSHPERSVAQISTVILSETQTLTVILSERSESKDLRLLFRRNEKKANQHLRYAR